MYYRITVLRVYQHMPGFQEDRWGISVDYKVLDIVMGRFTVESKQPKTQLRSTSCSAFT